VASREIPHGGGWDCPVIDAASNVRRSHSSAVAISISTAQSFRALSPRRLARLNYGGRHQLGGKAARKLIDAARMTL